MGKKQKGKNKRPAVIAPAPHAAQSGEHRLDIFAPAPVAQAPESVSAEPAAPSPPPIESPMTVASPPPRFDMSEIPSRRPAGAAALFEGPLVPGYDLDAEVLGDVAPIGPTEPGARLPTLPPGDEPIEAHDAAASSPEALEQQIRELEARLDQMIGQSRERAAPAMPLQAPSATTPLHTPPGTASPTPVPPARAERKSSQPPPESAPEETTAREVLPGAYYARQWGRAGMRSRAEEVDEFGLDPQFEARVRPMLDFLSKYYFRVETRGTEHVPSEGRCLLVANHAGGPLPYDGAMLRTALRREHPSHRELRWLAEDFIYYLPFVGTFMNRLGAVRACQENAERLLSRGALVAVFPEGAKGIGKLYRDRYKLQRFGRGGFIRLCLRTRTPLVPCAIVGAEEANPMLYRIEYMTKAFGIPYFPVTPTFPALGALGLMPAPTKWKIELGEPMHFDGYGPEAADDEILVGRLAERVRGAIQGMLDRMLAERRSVWLG